MTLYVVDASVAVKWVVEEPGTQQAMALLNRHELAAPDLILAECANISGKRCGAGSCHCRRHGLPL